MTPKFHSGNCRFLSTRSRTTVQLLTPCCFSWSVASMSIWARSVRHRCKGIGSLVLHRLVSWLRKGWGHDPKIPQRQEKSYVTFLMGVPYMQKSVTVQSASKNQLFDHCLLGCKRWARLPRPPLDTPSVGLRRKAP